MRKLTEAQALFTEVPMDRMEMYNLLAAIYLKTCVHYEKVSLRNFIDKVGGPTIRGKRMYIYAAMINMKLLLTEGKTSGTRYKWNMKKHGPVSLFIADMLIKETNKEKRRKNNAHARRRYASGKHKCSTERKNNENDLNT